MTTTVLPLSRHYKLSSTISCGYNFLKKVYYVTNRGYTTERTPDSVSSTVTGGDIAWEALCSICNIAITATQVSVTEGETTNVLTKANFIGSINKEENIENLYYTYSDNGEYIKSIRINDYEDYLLCIDCEKSKIYITNTNYIYDLTTNVADTEKIGYITLFYKQQLGLGHISNETDIFKSDITALYNKLVSYYAPTIYNGISTSTKDEDVLVYNNTIALTNYKGTGNATYNITCNPYNTYETDTRAYIKATSVEENKIYLTGTPNTTINTGDTVLIKDANNTSGTVTYSADGEFTVKEYDSDSATIVTNENIPYSYTFPYRKGYLINSSASIQEISRTTSTITLTTTVPSTIKVGDTITVTNTTQTDQSESITCNGEYEVMSLSDALYGWTYDGYTVYTKTLTLEATTPLYNANESLYTGSDFTVVKPAGSTQYTVYYGSNATTRGNDIGSTIKIFPEPSYNYTYSSSTMSVQGEIYKRVYLGNITGIEHNVASEPVTSTLTLNSTITALSSGDKIAIDTEDSNSYDYTVTASTTTSITFTKTNFVDTDPNYSYTPDYAKLQKYGNSPYLLLNVTECNKEYLIPTGEVMFDSLEALQKYLSIYGGTSGIPAPTSSNTSAANTDVPLTNNIIMGDGTTIAMQLEGLYNKVYES